MTAAYQHEAVVAARFDTLQTRFRPIVDEADYRLAAVARVLGPLGGLRLVDLGCGKGRFASRWRSQGADVVGLDLSAEMLRRADGFDRVRGSARRLPFADGAFDAVVAVEVLQHLPPATLDDTLAEVRRVTRPGGRIAVVDRNALALDARRPWLPAVVVKAIDERRGLWMYRPGDGVRERWFRPSALARDLARWFEDVRVEPLLSPAESARRVFRLLSGVRSMMLWSARVPGGEA